MTNGSNNNNNKSKDSISRSNNDKHYDNIGMLSGQSKRECLLNTDEPACE